MDDRRKTERIPVNIGVSCRVPASPVSARILDLSHFGCQLETPSRRVPAGSTVNISFDSEHLVSGQVQWSAGDRVGVWFARPLGKKIAVQLGLEQPEPEEPEAEPEPESPTLGVLLHHWLRRMTGHFAR